MTIREAVAAYLAAGYKPVPIRPGTKKPFHEDFATRPYTPEDFAERDNVGLVLGGGLVDVDLDQPEAWKAARMLMPETRMSGRQSKPGSHYWFKCGINVKFVFADLDNTAILEVRADGKHQTVVPPSVHESGEVLIYEHDRPELSLTPDEFWLPVRATAITALFARHWPIGGRHYAAGHVAGFLLRLGFDGPWTIQIIRAIATIAGDEEVNDRVAIARSTAEKHARGEKTTGGPKLAEIFGRGQELTARVYSWMGKDGGELLDQLNEKHFVAEMGNSVVVGTERTDRATAFCSFNEFREKYYNQRIGKTRLGEWYLSHPQRRTYGEIVFAPPPLTCHAEDYNIWRGFTVEPDPNPHPEERCARFLEHIYRVIVSENQVWFEYLLDLLALTVQRPGEPTGVAFVMRGDQGAGKGQAFADMFGSLFGAHYTQVSSQDNVTGNFNAHLAGKVVVFADEAFWAGTKSDIGALKRLVTERTLSITRKHRDMVTEQNCIHLIMATNEEWVWPAGFHERRGFIVDVELKDFATAEYFDALFDEWRLHGGAAAFLAFCQQRVVPRNRLGKPPQTGALEDQQMFGLDGIHKWWHEKLMQGEIGLGDGWPDAIAAANLYFDYLDTMDILSTRERKLLQNTFGRAFAAMLPKTLKKSKKTCSVRESRFHPQTVMRQAHCYQLPPLADCRKAFDRVTGIRCTWPTVYEQLALEER